MHLLITRPPSLLLLPLLPPTSPHPRTTRVNYGLMNSKRTHKVKAQNFKDWIWQKVLVAVNKMHPVGDPKHCHLISCIDKYATLKLNWRVWKGLQYLLGIPLDEATGFSMSVSSAALKNLKEDQPTDCHIYLPGKFHFTTDTTSSTTAANTPHTTVSPHVTTSNTNATGTLVTTAFNMSDLTSVPPMNYQCTSGPALQIADPNMIPPSAPSSFANTPSAADTSSNIHKLKEKIMPLINVITASSPVSKMAVERSVEMFNLPKYMLPSENHYCLIHFFSKNHNAVAVFVATGTIDMSQLLLRVALKAVARNPELFKFGFN
ncbi:hypothetical protein CONPUDRAFT_75938 [Coniophora puteana RWD-64-598 SS2]|uniref:Uncharacterized protein n=1 Tax=Coniophora puteana (strain RWD-64-598) TaxID=741705 RepID=A0A5M3MDF0_CONPW|nr:uncharacterized protein CONPUDRAFT_75938 [Coniophora puteana RWD-64-598 SS2]EIW77143.1 hypothetical protein CONPUDRAFT_75938 [Coniophora puteana RWD-64-598 SS2]